MNAKDFKVLAFYILTSIIVAAIATLVFDMQNMYFPMLCGSLSSFYFGYYRRSGKKVKKQIDAK